MVLLLMKEDDDDDGEETMQCARAIPLESAPRRRIICGNLTSHDNDDDEEDATIVATQPINVQLSNLDYSFHPRLSLLTGVIKILMLVAKGGQRIFFLCIRCVSSFVATRLGSTRTVATSKRDKEVYNL